MMEGQFENPPATIVSQQEAAEMIELWTRSAEAQEGSTLSLQDVAEALHISPAQAEQLLRQVRKQPLPTIETPAPWYAAPLYTLLTISVVYTVVLCLCLIAAYFRTPYYDTKLAVATIITAAWSTIWIAYYRRPLARFFTRLVRGFANGRA